MEWNETGSAPSRLGTPLATGLDGMTRPHIHTLYFTDRFRLSAAFERIIGDELVESCVVETDELRIRFVTRPSARAC